MATDWYPQTLADRVGFHANFAAQALIDGTAHGLTAAQVAQSGTDSTNVAACVNYVVAVAAYAQAVTAFKDILLEGEVGVAVPIAPTAPTITLVAIGTAAAIEARTRQYAALIKASIGFTPEIGERYGIIPAAPSAPTTPVLAALALTGSQISLSVRKGGYSVVAIDGRVAGGAWSQIGISMTATYVDGRPPAVAGAPELREYRAQGMANNARVGALSGIVSAVTVP